MLKEIADMMKHKSEYFYPFDIRSSGKDLIPNHLTFCAYIHAALISEEKWPLSMCMNGHLMVNGLKVLKSKGNLMWMCQCIEKFGADATQLCLGDVGDAIEDANPDEETANANILHLHTLIAWCGVNTLDSLHLSLLQHPASPMADLNAQACPPPSSAASH